MQANNPVESLAKAVYSAVSNPEILPDITRTFRNATEKVRPEVGDCSIYHFPQMWGSTALGFGGIGGAAMTTAYTTVVICEKTAAIFFGGRLAYCIDDFPDELIKDVKNNRMPSLSDAAKYNESTNPATL